MRKIMIALYEKLVHRKNVYDYSEMRSLQVSRVHLFGKEFTTKASKMSMVFISTHNHPFVSVLCRFNKYSRFGYFFLIFRVSCNKTTPIKHPTSVRAKTNRQHGMATAYSRGGKNREKLTLSENGKMRTHAV